MFKSILNIMFLIFILKKQAKKSPVGKKEALKILNEVQIIKKTYSLSNRK